MVGRLPHSIHEDKEDIFQNCLRFPINWNPSEENWFGFSKHQCTQHLPVPCPIRTLAGGIWSTCLEMLITWNSVTVRSLQTGAVLLQPSTTNHPPAFQIVELQPLLCAPVITTHPLVSVCFEGKCDGCCLTNTARPVQWLLMREVTSSSLTNTGQLEAREDSYSAVASHPESTSLHNYTNLFVFWPTCNSLHVVDWNISGVSLSCVWFFGINPFFKWDYTIKCCPLKWESVVIQFISCSAGHHTCWLKRCSYSLLTSLHPPIYTYYGRSTSGRASLTALPHQPTVVVNVVCQIWVLQESQTNCDPDRSACKGTQIFNLLSFTLSSLIVW